MNWRDEQIEHLIMLCFIHRTVFYITQNVPIITTEQSDGYF